MKELHHERLRRLRAEERITAKALYGWNHPANVEWAARRADEDRGGRDEDWQRWAEDQIAYLENRLLDLEQEVRRSADEPQMPVADDEPQADNAVGDEPILIRRKGEGRRHAN